MSLTPTQFIHWDPKIGKAFLSGGFTFQCLDGEFAIFQTLCAPELQKDLVEICKRHSPPDVTEGEIVHNVEIPEMSVDWDTLTLTCPWRSLIGRVMTEELRVEALQEQSNRETMTAAKRARQAADSAGEAVSMDAMMELFKMFARKGRRYMSRYAPRGAGERIQTATIYQSYIPILVLVQSKGHC
ncbi:hypothetical protein K438DRAFT_2019836 [Mycena galopus ATCC 62051]|nr:hypothetical protein K438DRAFT_2019836 [Mycena galopus ATCC 62051]